MKPLSEFHAKLLKMIQADEELTRWLYYSTQYNGGIDAAARDFVEKVKMNRQTSGPSVSAVKAVIPRFIAEFE